MEKDLGKIMARMNAEASKMIRESDIKHYQAALMIDEVRRRRFDQETERPYVKRI